MNKINCSYLRSLEQVVAEGFRENNTVTQLSLNVALVQGESARRVELSLQPTINTVVVTVALFITVMIQPERIHSK